MAKKSFKGTGADLFLSNTPAVTNLKINPEFKTLIPPLEPEEYSQLEENLIQNGIREAISLWNDTIIDGHNRYEIAQKHGLSFTTVSYEFETENDVITWIVKNQAGRRNLSTFARVKLALKAKEIISARAKENQRAAGGAKEIPQNDASAATGETYGKIKGFTLPQISAEALETREEIAKIAGTSHDTVSKVEKILSSATHDIITQLERGDITVNKAYQETREIKTQEKKPAGAKYKLPSGKFNVIYANPPWQHNSPAVSLENIKSMKIPSEKNAVLLLWAEYSMLPEALEVMKSWGFKYNSQLIWDKESSDEGYWVKTQHEVLLIGTKGSFKTPTPESKVSSIYREQYSTQSAKPAYFYSVIEQYFPDGKYLELFAREQFNEKWTVWANQIESGDK